ncbi:AAA family ATPase, partial [Variovorax paradoxus]|nr:AAA family ATPase [Variovorax paradoxus]
MHPVIYLTGAPASGKSTLSGNLKLRYPELTVFAYSEELRKTVAMRGENLAEDDIRRLSARVITIEDVNRLDQTLIERVATERLTRPFLIDSHPVTKETFGFLTLPLES